MSLNNIASCLSVGFISFCGVLVNANAEPAVSTQETKVLSENELATLAHDNWVSAPEESFKYAKQLVDKYDSDYGKQYLATMYHHGYGTDKNTKLAIKYYRESLNKDDKSAELKYITDLCAEKNYENNNEAYRRLEKLTYSLQYLSSDYFDALLAYCKVVGGWNIESLIRSIAEVDDVDFIAGISALEEIYKMTGSRVVQSALIEYQTKAGQRLN